jgi:hypothetical protein
MCMWNRIQIWPKDSISHIFQRKLRELPLHLCIRYVQEFVCVNINYVMHMRVESQQIRLEKHMLSLPKSDSPVWQTGPSDFHQAKPIKPKHPIYKTGTFGFSRLSILTRKHSSLYFRHSKIHICIKLT